MVNRTPEEITNVLAEVRADKAAGRLGTGKRQGPGLIYLSFICDNSKS